MTVPNEGWGIRCGQPATNEQATCGVHDDDFALRSNAIRTADGPLVKRLRKRDHRWWADSDNEQYEPQPLDDRARIMGRVVWWAHTDW